jgi:hypothetical protein
LFIECTLAKIVWRIIYTRKTNKEKINRKYGKKGKKERKDRKGVF